jgi:hypothetical protein
MLDAVVSGIAMFAGEYYATDAYLKNQIFAILFFIAFYYAIIGQFFFMNTVSPLRFLYPHFATNGKFLRSVSQ